MLLPCNRNKVITNENGDLIPVDDTSEKGIFTSFRGYFYVTNDAPIDNPPTRNRTGKIALKIPQFISYGDPNSPTSNFNKWVWKHYKFDYGNIYSVAQKNSVRYDTMSSENEKTEGLLLENVTTGFDEQTNILFVGGFEEASVTVSYARNNNTGDTRYKDFYNHVTVLGIDVDNSVVFSSEGANGNQKGDENNTGDNSTQPPPPPIVPPDLFYTYDINTTVDSIKNNTAVTKTGWNMAYENLASGILSVKIKLVYFKSANPQFVYDQGHKYRLELRDNDIFSKGVVLNNLGYTQAKPIGSSIVAYVNNIKPISYYADTISHYIIFDVNFLANTILYSYKYYNLLPALDMTQDTTYNLFVKSFNNPAVQKIFIDALRTSVILPDSVDFYKIGATFSEIENNTAVKKIGWNVCYNGYLSDLTIKIVLKFDKTSVNKYVYNSAHKFNFKIKNMVMNTSDGIVASVLKSAPVHTYEDAAFTYLIFDVNFGNNTDIKTYYSLLPLVSEKQCDLIVNYNIDDANTGLEGDDVAKTFTNALITSQKRNNGQCDAIINTDPFSATTYNLLRKWSPWNEY